MFCLTAASTSAWASAGSARNTTRPASSSTTAGRCWIRPSKCASGCGGRTRSAMPRPELNFDRIHQMPKPIQPGGVPIWVSGTVNRRRRPPARALRKLLDPLGPGRPRHRRGIAADAGGGRTRRRRPGRVRRQRRAARQGRRRWRTRSGRRRRGRGGAGESRCHRSEGDVLAAARRGSANATCARSSTRCTALSEADPARDAHPDRRRRSRHPRLHRLGGATHPAAGAGRPLGTARRQGRARRNRARARWPASWPRSWACRSATS